MIKFDQEASILDVKNALMMKSRDTEGFKVMPEESQVGASASNAMVERSVWKMQSTVRSLIAYAEWVQNTTFEPGSAILAWAVEYSGHVVSRFQRSVSDGKTAWKAEKLSNSVEKPKDKGEVRNRLGIMLGFVEGLTKWISEQLSE